MTRLIAPQHRTQFFFASLLIVVLAYLFWTGSRYPALDEKAMMSGALQLEDNLSFEALVPITDDMTLAQKVFWSTLNWLNTNRKGMTFGILFAAAFLTAAGYLKQRSFRGGFANATLGLVIGTPLGVCVNCAAPIAQGMYASGLRAETTLAAMIASPTLNIVVLTMLFSLLPFYMVAAKIGLSLVVILVMVPLICRLLPAREIAAVEAGGACAIAPSLPEAPARALHLALWEVARNYVSNLWYILRLTLPLMLLAGFLGALVATLLPQDLILGLPFSVWVLIALAVVGVFLPVPIAFDVVVTGALLGLGLAHGYVMALLFTLGTFSIYSFFIVYQSVGPRAAWMLAGTVAGFGVLAGAAAEGWHRYQSDRALELLLQPQASAPAEPHVLGAAWAEATPGSTITLTATPLAPISPASETLFIRREAVTRGIDKPLEFSFRDMWPPFWEGRSLSSGDIDGDGDNDLVIASTEAGLYFYANDAGTFTPMGDAGPFADKHVFNAALADMDNDGLPDLVVATYLEGLWLWRNVDGSFGPEDPVQLSNRADAPLAMALSFADADGSGLLDVAVGNWAAGWYRRIPGEESRNRVLWNPAQTPEAFSDLPGIPGETLTILFSDVDGDGQADLLVGNDFDIPDYLYRGDGAGGFTMVDHASGMIPQTTTTTMAIKTGDLTGNGTREIYFAQIAGRSTGVSETLKMQDLSLYCSGIENPEPKAICERNMEIKTWYRSGNSFDPAYAGKCPTLGPRDAAECRAMLVKDLAIQRRDANICALIPADQPIPRAYCDLHFLPTRQPTEAEIELTHPQILRSNVLLELDGAAYTDAAEARGLDVGGWSWDTKLRDFDLDGDLDVYIVNGTWVPNEVSPSNLYFENDGTGDFVERSGPAGLEDYLMTAAATAFDADGDGDMDMLTHPVNGPLVFFENTSQAPRLLVSLEDGAGNRAGVGAQVRLIDDTGHVQLREIQSGGGFMSFDAPELSFGLAPGRAAAALEVRWPDGTRTRIEEGLALGQHLRVTRL